MTALLKCTNLTFAYGDIPVLKEVSFSVFPGEFIAFIGPNGSGKTTMLQLIMGFLKAQKGTLTVEKGVRIGYVPQAPNLDKEFPVSAKEVVEMGCAMDYRLFGGISAQGKKRALDALGRVGMSAFASAPFGSLSGGQAQKVLIARAIASNPTLLVLDEPTANVDAASEESILSLIDSLKKETTILLVTHDFHAVTKYVSRVLLFQKTVISLKPSELCNHYAIGIYHAPGGTKQ